MWLLFPALNQAFSKSPLWGNLTPGSYPVGFTVRLEYDYTRTFLPKLTYDGKKTEGERARPIQIAIWYPAQKSVQPAMAFQEYVWLAAQELQFDPLTPEKKEQSRRQFIQDRVNFSRANDAAADALLKLPTAVVRDVSAAEGSFPLVLFAPGSSGTTFSDSTLCEYLASHGYIVAAMPSMGVYTRNASVDQVGFYAYMQDIEFVYGYMHHFPNIDHDLVGIVGFSMGGSAATLVQLRNTDIDAAVYLDTGSIFSIVDGWFRPIPFYNRADLRVPQLYLTRKDAQFLDLDSLQSMPYTDRFLVLFEKGYLHLDFVSDGIFPSATTGFFATPRNTDPQPLYETVARYTLHFFDAYLKKDQQSMAFLLRSPDENKVPAGLMTTQYFKKLPPPPREQEYIDIVRNNFARAREIFNQFRETTPNQKLFREANLNAVGYEFLLRGLQQQAVDVFLLNTEAYPNSANAFDSLSEGCESAGRKEDAVKYAKAGLSLVEKDSALDERRRNGIRKSLEDRIKRLS